MLQKFNIFTKKLLVFWFVINIIFMAATHAISFIIINKFISKHNIIDTMSDFKHLGRLLTIIDWTQLFFLVISSIFFLWFMKSYKKRYIREEVFDYVSIKQKIESLNFKVGGKDDADKNKSV